MIESEEYGKLTPEMQTLFYKMVTKGIDDGKRIWRERYEASYFGRDAVPEVRRRLMEPMPK
jgi:hypothetical protein